jgi:hypothetical protein
MLGDLEKLAWVKTIEAEIEKNVLKIDNQSFTHNNDFNDFIKHIKISICDY